MSKSSDSACQPKSQDDEVKVRGAADGKELGQALDNGQDDDLQERHKGIV